MIRNYFKIAWRNLVKNKGFSFINIFGLSVGVAACILISVYILHESTYDKDVPNAKNVYRLVGDFIIDGRPEPGISFPAKTASTILTDFKEVLNSGRLANHFYGGGSNEIRFDGEAMQHHEDGFTYVDPSMIEIMGIEMIYGNAIQALSEPKTIVISEEISNKYFKNENPIGRLIYLNGNNEDPFKIDGVMKNFASNSHLNYDFLITLKNVEFWKGEQSSWTSNNYITYLVLRPDANPSKFEKKMSNTLINKYMKPALISNGEVIGETLEDRYHMYLQRLTDINLYSSHMFFESNIRNDIKIIWIFGIVALFILIIASINFVNLSTAKSANRAKEVGLRKVVGSTRSYLIGQFLIESILITLIAFSIGMILSVLLIPFFRDVTNIALEIPWSNPSFIPLILIMAILVGLLAGLYPSFYLSAFKPIKVLKGNLNLSGKSGGLRSSLVVFQFTVSMILIVGTIIINQQMNFILNSKIGYEKDQVVQIYGTNMIDDKVQTFKEEIKKLSGVSNVSISDYLPIEGTKRNGASFVNEGKDNIDETIGGQAWVIDEDYIETMGMNIIEGRNFIANRKSDDQAVIINQTMADKLRLENPIGKRISRYGTLFEVIGIVEDFNYNTLKESVHPLGFFRGISPTITSVKIKTDNVAAVLASIKNKWNEFVPNIAFRYEYMDTSFAKMYDNVNRIKSIFTTFAILAILVACLGLFALSAYMIEQRNKEMSIRKVLGASMKTIFSLLTKKFLGLVLISMAVAIPIAYYLMTKWLQDYEYSIDISWTVFVLAGFIISMIALITMSYHTIKAVLVNPMDNLRNE